MYYETTCYHNFKDYLEDELRKAKSLIYEQGFITAGELYAEIKCYGRYYGFNTAQYNTLNKMVDNFVNDLYKQGGKNNA